MSVGSRISLDTMLLNTNFVLNSEPTLQFLIVISSISPQPPLSLKPLNAKYFVETSKDVCFFYHFTTLGWCMYMIEIFPRGKKRHVYPIVDTVAADPVMPVACRRKWRHHDIDPVLPEYPGLNIRRVNGHVRSTPILHSFKGLNNKLANRTVTVKYVHLWSVTRR